VVISGAPLQSGEPAIYAITNYAITVTVHLIALHGSAFGDFDLLQLSALSP
jgi:hypothetical protein